MPFTGEELDFRPTLEAVIEARQRGGHPAEIARAFQRGLVRGVHDAILTLCEVEEVDTVVLSGGVFQNEMLLQDLKASLAPTRIQLWINHQVPPNDGGISLGQVALAVGRRPV